MSGQRLRSVCSGVSLIRIGVEDSGYGWGRSGRCVDPKTGVAMKVDHI